jgi:hypothetical protein
MEEKIFNIGAVKDLLEKEDYELVDNAGERELVRRIYLGSVFSLYPSGKYYAAFTNSNVSEEEAEKDELWFASAEAELMEIGAFLEHGEGDPADLFVVQKKSVAEEPMSLNT